MKAILGLVLAFLAGPALAGSVQLNWTFPMLNTDGSAVPATGAGAITSTLVEWGTCNGTAFGTKQGGATVAAPALTYTVTNLGPGTYCLRAAVVNSYGVQSDWTAAVTATIAPPKPLPPALTIGTIAYELRGYANGTFRMVSVGSVPLKAPCGQRLSGDYHLFDGATVTKPTTGGAITAKCATPQLSG